MPLLVHAMPCRLLVHAMQACESGRAVLGLAGLHVLSTAACSMGALATNKGR